MELKIAAELVDIQKCVDMLYTKTKYFQSAELALLHMTPEYNDYEVKEKAWDARDKAKDAMESTIECHALAEAEKAMKATLEYKNQVKLDKLLKGIEKLKKEYKAYAKWNAYIELYRTIQITNNKLTRELEAARKIYKVAKEVLNNEK